MNERWTLDDLLERVQTGEAVRVAMFVTPSVRPRVGKLLEVPHVDSLANLPPDLEILIVVGGGTAIDAAKLACDAHISDIDVIAVPTIWGSGAEASPVAVSSEAGKKVFRLDEALVPRARVVVPELVETASDEQLRWGCGDAWSHAYEALLSPLGSAELRAEIADLMREMLGVGVSRDARWFDLSARACDVQARSGVGLIHGIAHNLEGPAREQDAALGHARLCATFLAPVFDFNRQHSDKWDTLAAEHDLDADALVSTFRELHEGEVYRSLLPLLEDLWRNILRDPLTRINGVLVRPPHQAFFKEWSVG